ncbi:unnamed protein product [Toxocara canis]|uniref:Keratinocyte proline-rich protein n=1 Tax=Toxocara canis TaxID=6265 RepID=A0A183UKK6_TOXCA|nr:unnamed protein product [Toxocara canis]
MSSTCITHYTSPIFSGQSIGGSYGPGSVYNEPVYLAPGTTEAPQYIPQNPSYSLPYAPSGATISPGAPVNAPTVCVQICMPSCSAQCLQQQQQPIPVVQPSPLPFGPAGPGPLAQRLPGPIVQPIPEPITNAPPYQPPYIQQPTPVDSASADSTICIAVCMPSCSADCLQQNPVVPAYTPTPPYLPQPPFQTPVPSVTPLPPYQTVTPTPIPVVQQTPASVTCIQVCMPSCSAQCIDQQRPQPLPQPVPAPVVPPRPLLPQPVVPQPVEVTLPQSIQWSPNCVTLCQNACVQQCSQQNLGISQCSSPCSSTCSQSCPAPQPTVPIRPPVTTPPPFIPLTEPIPVTQPRPVPQPLPSYPTTQCQPSPGGLSKCSCPSGFIVCLSVSGSNQCCRKRK